MRVDLKKFLEKNTKCRIAVYGLGIETERFLKKYGERLSIVGLLDSYRNEGALYGYPIIPIAQAIDNGARLIIVVARPGSCKAIARKIAALCKENDVELYDVRGRNLLVEKSKHDFLNLRGATKTELIDKISRTEAISFDLFDTLITRRVYHYTDIFALMNERLKAEGIYIPNFCKTRISAEKDLSRKTAPTLIQIYKEVLRRTGGSFLEAEELADKEWELDFSTMLPRDEVCKVFRNAVANGKQAFIITDSYFRKEEIEMILRRFGISGYKELFVSSEYETSKTQHLFDEVILKTGCTKALHIGDDEIADIEAASARGWQTYRIFSGMDLFDAVDGFGMEKYMKSISDRVKIGLFISRCFNSPFWFGTRDCNLTVNSNYDIGYLFCAPIITNFVMWLRKRIEEEAISQILFCARDGYLVGRLLRKLDSDTRMLYFLTSRTAAIRAGMENKEDISYVESMKYFGTDEESVKARFGIDMLENECGDKNCSILKKAVSCRKNYRKYIEQFDIEDRDIAIFDFVAKGTVQMYLQKLFTQKLRGFYFLRLEPEVMADKNLDIEPFFSDEERDTSVIFNNYYILEAILTSPYPMVEDFDKNGRPMFLDETRSKQDIACIQSIQEGIADYFGDYVQLIPRGIPDNDKAVDEILLSLINQIEITNQEFLSLTVEDPFFCRMTNMKELLDER